jgi:uncharacterized membrane protein
MADKNDIIRGEQQNHDAQKARILDGEKERIRAVAKQEDISDTLIDTIIAGIIGALVALLVPDITISKLLLILLALGVGVLAAYAIAKAILNGSLNEFHRISNDAADAEAAEDKRYREILELLLKGS